MYILKVPYLLSLTIHYDCYICKRIRGVAGPGAGPQGTAPLPKNALNREKFRTRRASCSRERLQTDRAGHVSRTTGPPAAARVASNHHLDLESLIKTQFTDIIL